ncbi:MAG: hypothetical protein ACK5UQ_22530 [Planctomycetota bacterium]
MRAIAAATTLALALATAARAQCTTQIVPIPIGTNGPVHELLQLQNGDILLVGDFTSAFGVAANRIARWNGSAVTALGSGLNGLVRDALELPNGDLLVGGTFTTAGGLPAVGLARWDGSSWSTLGSGPGADVWSIAARPNGEIVVGTSHVDRARRWDGSAWSGLGLPPSPFVSFPVWAVHTMPNGDVVMSGEALVAVSGGFRDMARWDGTSVQAMPGLGSGTPSLLSGHAIRFAQLRDGTLYAAGGWSGIGVVRWTGTTWAVVPGTQVALGGALDLSELPNGDWLLGGGFLYIGPNQAARGVVRRRNGTWEPFGSGVTGGARSFLPLPNGDVLGGGELSVVDGQPANNLALLVPTCRATATSVGSGCSGGGPLALAALSLPFTGSTQRSLAMILPGNAFGVGILGFTPLALPLNTLLPQALAGCLLLASPDELTLLPPNGGTVTTSLVVPNVPSLVGAVLQQQVASVELGPGGAITAIATTNALQLTIGSS